MKRYAPVFLLIVIGVAGAAKYESAKQRNLALSAADRLHQALDRGDAAYVANIADPSWGDWGSSRELVRRFELLRRHLGPPQANKLRDQRLSVQTGAILVLLTYEVQFATGWYEEKSMWRIRDEQPFLAGYAVVPIARK